MNENLAGWIRHAARGTVLGFCVLACGDPVAVEDIPNIDGLWNYSESVTSQGTVTNQLALVTTCDRVGTLNFQQDGELFIGTFVRAQTCTASDLGTTAATESGLIESGRVIADIIEFTVRSCQYRGTLADEDGDLVSGTILCVTNGLTAETAETSAGSWTAQRLAESSP